jgi:hypothetical protein
MKNFMVMLSTIALCSWPIQANAQTPAYPAGQSYIISSSPTADGGVITTTYQPPHASNAVGATTLPGNPTVTQYRPLQTQYPGSQYPGSQYPGSQYPGSQYPGTTYPTVQTQFQTGSPLSPATSPPPATPAPATLPGQGGGFQPGVPPSSLAPTLPANPTRPASPPPATAQPLPTSPAVTHAPMQTWQTNQGVNPYVGFPLPQTADGRVVAYNTSGNACATVPANLPPTLQGTGGPQTVPVTQNYRPLIPIGGLPGGAYVSQGLWGNPRAYVQGQPVRNFWRYVIF